MTKTSQEGVFAQEKNMRITSCENQHKFWPHINANAEFNIIFDAV